MASASSRLADLRAAVNRSPSSLDYSSKIQKAFENIADDQGILDQLTDEQMNEIDELLSTSLNKAPGRTGSLNPSGIAVGNAQAAIFTASGVGSVNECPYRDFLKEGELYLHLHNNTELLEIARTRNDKINALENMQIWKTFRETLRSSGADKIPSHVFYNNALFNDQKFYGSFADPETLEIVDFVNNAQSSLDDALLALSTGSKKPRLANSYDFIQLDDYGAFQTYMLNATGQNTNDLQSNLSTINNTEIDAKISQAIEKLDRDLVDEKPAFDRKIAAKLKEVQFNLMNEAAKLCAADTLETLENYQAKIDNYKDFLDGLGDKKAAADQVVLPRKGILQENINPRVRGLSDPNNYSGSVLSFLQVDSSFGDSDSTTYEKLFDVLGNDEDIITYLNSQNIGAPDYEKLMDNILRNYGLLVAGFDITTTGEFFSAVAKAAAWFLIEEVAWASLTYFSAGWAAVLRAARYVENAHDAASLGRLARSGSRARKAASYAKHFKAGVSERFVDDLESAFSWFKTKRRNSAHGESYVDDAATKADEAFESFCPVCKTVGG